MINWSKVYRLSYDEFSEDPNKYAESKLIYALSDIRKSTRKRMFPSTVSGAIARPYGRKTSQHYIGNKKSPTRLSTASDIFCEGIPFFIYSTIIASNLFNGVGIYLDTKGIDGLPWIMFHVDLRLSGFNFNTPLIWITEKVYDESKKEMVNSYKYPQIEPKYWSLLDDKRFFYDKQLGIA